MMKDWSEMTPSKVIHVRELASDSTLEDLYVLFRKYGHVIKQMIIPNRNQALVEFDQVQSAVNVVQFNKHNPLFLGLKNKPVKVNFSTKKEISAIESGAAASFSSQNLNNSANSMNKLLGGGVDSVISAATPGIAYPAGPASVLHHHHQQHHQQQQLQQQQQMTQLAQRPSQYLQHLQQLQPPPLPPQQQQQQQMTQLPQLQPPASKFQRDEKNRVIRLIISNVQYNITIEVISKITAKFGPLLRIAINDSNKQTPISEVEALLEFSSAADAFKAKVELEGADIYSECCTIRTELTDLEIVEVLPQNGKFSWDFEFPDDPGAAHRYKLSVQQRQQEQQQQQREANSGGFSAANSLLGFPGGAAPPLHQQQQQQALDGVRFAANSSTIGSVFAQQKQQNQQHSGGGGVSASASVFSSPHYSQQSTGFSAIPASSRGAPPTSSFSSFGNAKMSGGEPVGMHSSFQDAGKTALPHHQSAANSMMQYGGGSSSMSSLSAPAGTAVPPHLASSSSSSDPAGSNSSNSSNIGGGGGGGRARAGQSRFENSSSQHHPPREFRGPPSPRFYNNDNNNSGSQKSGGNSDDHRRHQNNPASSLHPAAGSDSSSSYFESSRRQFSPPPEALPPQHSQNLQRTRSPSPLRNVFDRAGGGSGFGSGSFNRRGENRQHFPTDYPSASSYTSSRDLHPNPQHPHQQQQQMTQFYQHGGVPHERQARYEHQRGHIYAPPSPQYDAGMSAGDRSNMMLLMTPIGDGRVDLSKKQDNGNHVVILYEINMNELNCDKLFALLCIYGNVERVKFLHSKEGSAMVQMGDHKSVLRVIDHLNLQRIFGNILQAKVSRHNSLEAVDNPFTLPDGTVSYVDYSSSKLNRFQTLDMSQRNKVFRPSRTLHYWNCPPKMTFEDLKQLFKKAAAAVPNEHILLKDRENSSSGLLQWDKVSDAIEALIKTNHSQIFVKDGDFLFTMKLCFSEGAIRDDGTRQRRKERRDSAGDETEKQRSRSPSASSSSRPEKRRRV